MSSNNTHLLLLPGHRKHGLGPMPAFVTPPPGESDQELQRAVKAVLSAKRVAVVVGAGISTAANIPDFRSSSGLFASLKTRFPTSKITSGRDLFDINAWKDPETCSLHLGMLAELYGVCEKAQPTQFHKFLKELDDQGKLSRVYTQNIDGLEEKVGLSYGIPETSVPWRVRDSATQTGMSPKRGLKRKRGQIFPGNLPLTPPTTPPGSVCEGSDQTQVERAPSLSCSDLSGSELSTSSQLSTSTIRPLPPLPSLSKPPTVIRVRTRSAIAAEAAATAAVAAPSTSRPVRPKPADPFPRVIPLHGTLKDLTCSICRKSEPISDYVDSLSAGELVHCSQCEIFDAARAVSGFRPRGVGVLKSNVVLYGEEHNDGELVGAVTTRDLMKGRRPDLLIVAGTTLKVPGTKRLVKELSKVIRPPAPDSDSETGVAAQEEVKKPIHTIFLNNEFPAPCGFWKDTFDVWVKGDLSQFIELIQDERKSMEELKLRKAQEKVERDRKKEERLKASLESNPEQAPSTPKRNKKPATVDSNPSKAAAKKALAKTNIGAFFSVSKAGGPQPAAVSGKPATMKGTAKTKMEKGKSTKGSEKNFVPVVIVP